MNHKFPLRAAKAAVTLSALFVLSTAACFAQSGVKSLNSADDLKKYLDSQPVNSADKPIKVAIKVNDVMIQSIVKAINDAGKYVSLDLSGSPLKEIGGFSGCKALTSITLDPGNPNYTTEDGIVYNKAKTEIIIVPQGISGSVTIPNGVTRIEGYFYNLKNLKSITLPDSVDISDGEFSGCSSLTNVILGKGVTYIEEYSFSDCASLTSITIPAGVEGICAGAFSGCTSLTSVTFQGAIPSKEFSSSAFSGLGDLRAKYLAGGPGTYTKSGTTWTKK